MVKFKCVSKTALIINNNSNSNNIKKLSDIILRNQAAYRVPSHVELISMLQATENILHP